MECPGAGRGVPGRSRAAARLEAAPLLAILLTAPGYVQLFELVHLLLFELEQ
jgi:hypothetical protein